MTESSQTLEQRLLKTIEDKNMSPEELKRVLTQLQTTNATKYTGMKFDFDDPHVKFGVISDTHMGHKNYRPDFFEYAGDVFKKEDVNFIVNAGDTIEGMSGRDGHIYELTHIGATDQMNYVREEFKKLHGIPVFSIEADSSHGGWFRSKGNMGLDIGKELEDKIENYYFLGYDEQDLKLTNGLIIRLRHPGDGTAYAVSYKIQKYLESLESGEKPNIVVEGHYHKALNFFYRNMHAIEAGTFQMQSPFMKKKGTPAHVGFWTIDATVHGRKGNNEHKKKVSVTSFNPVWYPLYT